MPVYFVRHGESTANQAKICAGHTDVELTEKGREQAATAGQELRESGVKIVTIVSSPLKRAFTTARIIAEKIGKNPDDIVVSDLAIERFRGDYEGQPSASQEGATDEDYAKMNAESIEQMVERAKRLRQFIDGLESESVLVVSHNQFGCIFVATERNEPAIAEQNKIPNAHVIKI